MNEEEYIPSPPPTPKERNEITWEKYRREVRLQIYLPLGIAIFIVLILAALVTTGSFAEVSQWADVATIWLVAPMLIVTLIFLALFIAVAYGLAKLLQVLPFYTKLVQDFFVLVRDQVASLSDKMVAPILGIESQRASWRSLRKKISRK